MNRDLKILCILIGAIILACVVVGLPVLCGIAYALKWAMELKAVLTIAVVAEMALLAACIAMKANNN